MLKSNSRPPQIIVIPQSMLSQQTRNLLQYRMAGSNETIQLQQPLIIQQQQQQQQLIVSNKRAVLPLPRSRPIAAVVGKCYFHYCRRYGLGFVTILAQLNNK